MTTKTKNTLAVTLPSDREIILTRVFNAPRALVFKAYTDPRLIPQWWGPRGHATVVDKMDVRPGGLWRFVQTDHEGTVHAFRGEYREIVPPERLVDTFEYEPWAGHISVETVTFVERDGKTTVTIHTVFSSPRDRDGMLESGMETGATQTMDRLEDLLASGSVATVDREVVVSRLLMAPRTLVYEVFTDPKQVNQWWGPDGFKNVDVKMDVRVGGAWTFKMIGPDGTAFPNRIVYRELSPPDRLVYDHGEEGALDFTATITFEEVHAKTLLTLRLLFPSKEVRDTIVEKYHAIEGAKQELAKLEAYLNKL
jgi:uncharacterized protein YndB with AHSA1/START domain